MSIELGNGVTFLEPEAFRFNQLTALTIPNNVTSIGANTFSDNQLSSVKISSGLTELSWGLFSNNNFTSITIPDHITELNYSHLRFKGSDNWQVVHFQAITKTVFGSPSEYHLPGIFAGINPKVEFSTAPGACPIISVHTRACLELLAAPIRPFRTLWSGRLL